MPKQDAEHKKSWVGCEMVVGSERHDTQEKGEKGSLSNSAVDFGFEPSSVYSFTPYASHGVHTETE